MPSVIELNLRRRTFPFDRERTVGDLYYDGKPFGFVVEDVDRGLTQGQSLAELAQRKVQGKTAIAAGVWPIVLEASPKYGPDTLTVLVQGHRYIRIHVGNDEDDTEGCICPGLHLAPDGKSTVKSTEAVAWLRKQLVPHLAAGGQVWLRITRDGGAVATPSGK